MAVACAAAALLQRRALDLDLVMLIEGEEEAGSGGFSEAVKKHKVPCVLVVIPTHLTPLGIRIPGLDWSHRCNLG